MRDAESESSVL